MTSATDTGMFNTDKITSNTTPVFTGTAEANSTVNLYHSDGTTLLGTATADGSGNWSITSSALSEGTHTLTAKATDAAGNTSVASSSLAVTIDTTAPTVTVASAAFSADTGTSSSDFITNTAAQTISGTLSANLSNGETVYVSLDNGSTWTAATATVGQNTWSLSGQTLTASNTLKVRVSDTAGNNGTAYSQAYVLDTTPPTTTVATKSFSADTGSSSTDFITKTAAQTISGTLSANVASGEVVYVSLDNGSTWSTATTSVGANTWSLSGQTLAGSNTLKVKVTDAAGNDGTVSSQAYVLDTTAPTTTVATQSFSADTGTSSTDFVTKTASQTVSGTVSANMVAGEIVEVSLDNGSTWTTATTTVGSNTWTLSGVTLLGSNTLKVRVSDSAGNSGTVYNQAYVLDQLAPTVSNVTSSTANGTYKVGDTISVQVNFTEAVTITGTPQLTLETGTTDRVISYAGGSGTSTLTFTYTVQAGDTTSDLDYISTSALTLNGGTIMDAAGNNATLTLATTGATNSLGDNKNIVIDGNVPTTTSVSVPSNSTYGASANLDFTINFSENVTVNTSGGTPRIALTIGSTTRYATYVSGSGTSALLFRYTTVTGDNDSDGIAVAGTMDANGGTLQDAAGNDATLTLNSVGSTAAVLVSTNQVPVLSTPTTATYSDTSAADSFSNTMGTLSATDNENDTITYGITGGTVSGGVSTKAGTYGSLSVNTTTGAYTYTPNTSAIEGRTANTSETFTVTASDASSSGTATFTVSITAANDTPTLTAPTAGAYTDTSANDTFSNDTGTLAGADRDAGQTLTYGISGGSVSGGTSTKAGSYGSLSVNTTTGAYTYTPNATAINALTANTTDTFIVTVSDGAGGSNTATYAVNLTAANDTPTLTTPTAGAYTDTSANDTFSNDTGTLAGADRDAGQTLTYGISGGSVSGGTSTKAGSYGSLSVNTTTGTYTYTPNATAINALTASTTDTFTVTVSDGAGGSNTATYTVNLTAANDTPTLTTPTAGAYTDTSANDTFSNDTGTLAGADRDAGQTLTYGISGGSVSGGTSTKAGSYGSLSVNTTTGAYTYTPNATAINALTANTTDTFTVTVSDGAGGSNTATYTVNITGVNDLPTDINLTSTSVTHSGGANATVGTLSTTDADTGDTHTYSLVSGTGDTNNGLFNISGTSLRATNAASMSPGTYTVRVQTTDAASATYAKVMTITVADDVAPTVTSVSVPSNAWYMAGQNLDFTVNFSESVTVVTTGGTPRIALTVGTTTVYADYVSGSGTTALVFRYTVQTNDLDTNGIAVGTLALNGGSLADAAGNNAVLTLNSVGSTSAVLVDAVNPSAPSTPDLALASDSGTSGTDNITNDTTPTFTGTAEAGSTVTLYDTDGTTVLGTATATGGNWSITSSTLSSGNHTIYAKVTDAAGNVSNVSTGLAITIDATAPSAVALSTTSLADNLTTSGSTLATLSATDSSGLTYSLVSGAGDTNNGSFTITGSDLKAGGSNLAAGTYNIRVRASDAAGNFTDQTFTFTVTAGPSVASINRAVATALTNASSVDFTVTFSESVNGVDVSDFVLTTTGTAGGTIASITGSGNTYTVTVNGLSGDGTLRLDLNNNGTGIINAGTQAITGGFTSGQSYTLDKTAPTAPTGLEMIAASDSGSSNSDNITSVTTPVITGSGAEAGATVTLYDTNGTTVLGTATADSSGNWSVTSSTLSSGVHTLTTKVTDAGGNTGVASAGLTVTIDTTAPTASGAPVLASASDSGASSTDNITSVTTPVITGSGAEAGATVTLYDTNGTTVLGTATADGSGNWSITSSTLSSGAHTLTTKVTDAAGNTGVASAGLTVTIDTTAPSNISLNANTFMDLSTGINTALATLSSSDVHQVRYALVVGNGTNDSGNGGFVISGNSLQSARDLAAGTYNVRVSATDAAGNVSYQDLRIVVTPHPAVNRPDVAVSSPVRTVQPSVMQDTTMPVIPVNIVSVPAPSAYLVQSSERASSFDVPAVGRTVNGFSVPVLNRESASSPDVMVLRGMSDQSAVRVGSQLVVNFEVPASTFAHTDPSAVVTLTAVMADGRPLPAWLKFNPITGEFRGIAPANYSGLLELSVVATDNQGSKAVTRFKIDLTAKPAKSSDLGKPRLQAELRGQSSFAWKAERDAWIRHAREVGKTGRAITSA